MMDYSNISLPMVKSWPYYLGDLLDGWNILSATAVCTSQRKSKYPLRYRPLFSMMESKLLKVIMTPAMIATWGFGLSLAIIPGVLDWSEVWPWVKLISIVAMTWFHFWLAKRQRDFEHGENI